MWSLASGAHQKVCSICTGHRQENIWDSLLMLAHSPTLLAVNTAFLACVIGLNVFGLLVTRSLGSVFRAVLLTTRTASVSVKLGKADCVFLVVHLQSWPGQPATWTGCKPSTTTPCWQLSGATWLPQ